MSLPTVADKLGLSFPFFAPPADKTDVSEREIKLLILAGLSALATGINSIADGSAGAQRTPSATVRTTSGTITAGAKSVTLVFSSDFAGTVMGAAFPAGLSSLTFPPNGADTLGAIAYTISAGSITSYEVR